MSHPFMPGFQRFPKEGAAIGRLLAGYGELEFEMCRCLEAAIGSFDSAFKLLFRTRGEKKRYDRADRIMRPMFVGAGLGAVYSPTMTGMDSCRLIRNQYAHCNWYDTSTEGLCFVDLEATAQLTTPVASVTANRRPIDVALLTTQEDFFSYIQGCFWHLHYAHDKAKGRPTPHVYDMPSATRRSRSCR
jgi:hypothetical protein